MPRFAKGCNHDCELNASMHIYTAGGGLGLRPSFSWSHAISKQVNASGLFEVAAQTEMHTSQSNVSFWLLLHHLRNGLFACSCVPHHFATYGFTHFHCRDRQILHFLSASLRWVRSKHYLVKCIANKICDLPGISYRRFSISKPGVNSLIRFTSKGSEDGWHSHQS